MKVDLRSLVGGISVGLDRSDAFAVSPRGLAIRDRNGRYKARDGQGFIDVTEVAWSLEDQSWVLRVPVPVEEVQEGDLIVLAEDPVRVMLVRKNPKNGPLPGITVDGEIFEFQPARSFFLQQSFVPKLVSAFDVLGVSGKGEASMPLLALALSRGGPEHGAGMALLLSSVLAPKGGGPIDPNMLMFAALAGRERADGWLDKMLLALALRHPSSSEGALAAGAAPTLTPTPDTGMATQEP